MLCSLHRRLRRLVLRYCSGVTDTGICAVANRCKELQVGWDSRFGGGGGGVWVFILFFWGGVFLGGRGPQPQVAAQWLARDPLQGAAGGWSLHGPQLRVAGSSVGVYLSCADCKPAGGRNLNKEGAGAHGLSVPLRMGISAYCATQQGHTLSV